MRECADKDLFLAGKQSQLWDSIRIPENKQKASEQKLSSTMAEPFAGSSGTAIATYTKPSR
jgi:hypothetical protein